MLMLSTLPLTGCVIHKLSANLIVEKDLENPIVVDFVFIFDESVLEALHKVPSSEWFAKREQYKLDWEISKKIQVLSFELVPGQQEQLKYFKPRTNPIELLIFASYLTQGDHRIALTDYSFVTLFINKDDIIVKDKNLR